MFPKQIQYSTYLLKIGKGNFKLALSVIVEFMESQGPTARSDRILLQGF